MANEIRQAVRRAGAWGPHPLAMVALAELGAVVGQFVIELGAGRVPVPAAYLWPVPVVSAGWLCWWRTCRRRRREGVIRLAGDTEAWVGRGSPRPEGRRLRRCEDGGTDPNA